MRDDVALYLRRTARNGARIGSDVTREPAAGEYGGAVRVIRCGKWRTEQSVDSRRVQRVPEGILLSLGSEQLQHRNAGYVPLAGCRLTKGHRAQQPQRLIVHGNGRVAVPVQRPIRPVILE